MKTWIALSFLVVAGCSGSRLVRVPVSEGDRAELNRELASDHVKLQLADGARVEGDHFGVLPDGTATWTSGAEQRKAPPEALRSLEVRRPLRGAFWGMFPGAFAGLLVGGAVGSMGRCSNDCDPAATIEGALLGAAAGGLVGAVVGAFGSKDVISFAKQR